MSWEGRLLGEIVSQAPVYLVGGNGLFRRGLIGFLENTDFQPVTEFDAVQECLERRGVGEEPDVIVYISSGDVAESGAAVDSLLGLYPSARLVVLCEQLSVDELGECLKLGAGGYLLNSISKDALIHSLTLILLGETVFPSSLAAAWVASGLSGSAALDLQRMRDLTQREIDILERLTEGASNKLIARRLGITESTVKIHMKSLIRKLGVSNRTQAALWAIRAGLGDEAGHDVGKPAKRDTAEGADVPPHTRTRDAGR